MNKPLVAAITGVAFGATLTGAVIFVRSQTRMRHCPHRVTVVRTVAPPPRIVAPPPSVEMHFIHKKDPCPRLVESPLEDYDMQLTEAQSEYVNGNYECAEALARSVADKSPTRAYRIIGAAACQLKELGTLRQVERRLDAPARQYVTYVCQRSGVVRTKRGWALSDE